MVSPSATITSRGGGWGTALGSGFCGAGGGDAGTAAAMGALDTWPASLARSWALPGVGAVVWASAS
jgi:hypothetical protein